MGESSLDNRDLCFSLKMLQRSKEDTKKKKKEKKTSDADTQGTGHKSDLTCFLLYFTQDVEESRFHSVAVECMFSKKNKKNKNKGGVGGQDTTFQISIQTSGNTTELAEIAERLHFLNISQLIVLQSMQIYKTCRSQSMGKIYIC